MLFLKEKMLAFGIVRGGGAVCSRLSLTQCCLMPKGSKGTGTALALSGCRPSMKQAQRFVVDLFPSSAFNLSQFPNSCVLFETKICGERDINWALVAILF